MAVSDQVRTGDLAEVLKTERNKINNQLRVAMPGIIQSFDPESVTCVVQPAIRYVQTDNDGNQSTNDYPLLLDVPVIFRAAAG